MLTEEQFTQWLKDLRSGEYHQGRMTLRRVNDDTTTYCCLGVLADKCLVIENITETGVTHYIDPSDSLGYRHFLPESFIPLADQRRLATLNDSRGMSFAEIADHLEKYKNDYVAPSTSKEVL